MSAPSTDPPDPARTVSATDDAGRRHLGLRLGGLYWGVFWIIGIHMPFFPVWLSAQGLGATQIGWLMAAIQWAKVFANPAVGHLVDSHGRRRRTMFALCVLSGIGVALYIFAEGFWPLLLLSLVFGLTFTPMIPLTEGLAVKTAQRGGLDYGSMRLWGSISFITASFAGGQLLDLSVDSVYWLLLAGFAMLLAGCLVAPSIGETVDPEPPPPWSSLLKNSVFLVFIAAVASIQSSHAVYHAFASLHWREAGLSSTAIGALWAFSVLIEVGFFAIAGKYPRILTPMRLILAGGLGGMVRWTILSTSTAVPLLFIAQSLHTLTFAATHLGTMLFIGQALPSRLNARGQAVYSALAMGLVLGGAMMLAGPLYERFEGLAFLLSAAQCALGTVFALWLFRRWDGGDITRRHDRADAA